MNVSKSEIEDLQTWLAGRLPDLIKHGDKVRELLKSANRSEEIIASATQLVANDTPSTEELSPQQLAVWQALLPLLAEHGLLAVRNGKPAPDEDKPFAKEAAAEYLGFSVRKLERAMKKRQIAYEKFGVGRSATVRFRRSELDKFRTKREVRTVQDIQTAAFTPPTLAKRRTC